MIFRPVYYEPTFSKFQNKQCGGVQVHVTNRDQFDSVMVGASILKAIYELYPAQTSITSGVNRLFGIANFDQLIKT